MLVKNSTDLLGYKLFDLGLYFEFHFKFGIFRGNLKQICTYAVHQHGFRLSEIETAVLEMEKHWHNAAEFGMMKSFMYSYDREVGVAS